MRNKIAYTILRITLAAVFLIFGIGKFRNDIWAQTIRQMGFFRALPWDTGISVFFIGLIETITGLALLAGIFTRFFAAVAAAQLAGILVLLNFQETRDIGLLGAAIYLSLVKRGACKQKPIP
jgi:uncharacterized membrane protein YphA (DoxX/SURF4 family)